MQDKTTIAHVTTSWKGTILTSQKIDSSFILGESPDSHFVIGSLEKINLIEKHQKGFILNPPNGVKEILVPGNYRIVTIGDIEFQIEVSFQNKPKYRRSLDYVFGLHVAGVSILSLAFYGLLVSIPEEALALDLDDSFSSENYARYFHQEDKKSEEPETIQDASDQEQKKQSIGKRTKGPEGQTGSSKAKSRSGKLQVKGSNTLSLSRDYDPDRAARNAGILGILASQESSFLASPTGSFLVGQDDSDIWGPVTGTDFLEGYGTGGLGIVGMGKRGGGNAEGLIGLGNTGLIRPDFKRSQHAVGFGPKVKKPPVVSIGKVKSSGVDKEIVRRIVRAHINEIRSCYNTGLTKNPNLEGRVLVQFSILGTGKVSGSVVLENTTKSPSVANCISKAVKRWKFPQGKGLSIVSYPFMLRKS